MKPIFDINELRGYAHPLIGSPDTAQEECSYVQLVTNHANIDISAFEGKGRVSCYNMKLIDLRQRIDDLFCHPVSKYFIGWIRTHARERKHRNGIIGCTWHRNK